MTKKHAAIPPVHPGEVIREDVLPALGMSKTEVARRLGISRQMLYDILHEKKPVTAQMAVRFGELFGKEKMWRKLQLAYDMETAQRRVTASRGRTRRKDAPPHPAPSIRLS